MSTEPVKPQTVWTFPEAEKKQPTLLRLTADHLCLATVPAADLDKTVAALEAGGDVVSQNIPLTKITQIEGDAGEGWVDTTVSLTVTYNLSNTQTETAAFQLTGRKDWDELSDALLGRFGPGWERRAEKTPPWCAALLPLGILLVAGLVTWWMHSEASRIAAGEELPAVGRSKTRTVITVMHLVEGWIGTTGVLILGAVVLLLCLLWLWYTVAYPGVHVSLRSKEAP